MESAYYDIANMDLQKLKSLIRDVPDFPIKGVLFRDIVPLLQSAEANEFIYKTMGDLINLNQIDHFAGIESRGFIFASALAVKYKKGFLPIRKKGKLPPPTVEQSYALEYGNATIELNPGSGRVCIVDDVLATGGTLQAAISLSRKAGFEVVDLAVLIDLTFLNDFKFNDKKVKSIIQY